MSHKYTQPSSIFTFNIKEMKDRVKSDNALMGATHSLSSVALYLLFMAFFPQLFVEVLGTDSIYVILISIFTIYGASLLPDLDNTRSSAISSLGIIGQGLSSLLRMMAVGIYHLTKTKHDNPECNPHRGFFHTIVSVVFVFLVVFSTTSITYVIKISDSYYTVGQLFALFWLFITTQISLASISGPFFKKNKKKGMIGHITNLLISLSLSFFLMIMATKEVESFQWLAFAISFGYLAHILGDTLTVGGTPLLFPIKTKGKRWYVHRFSKMKAGGEIEKIIVVPFFGILIIISIVRIGMYLVN